MVRKDLFHSVHHYTIWYSSWYVQYISTFIALGSLRIATGSKQRKERKKSSACSQGLQGGFVSGHEEKDGRDWLLFIAKGTYMGGEGGEKKDLLLLLCSSMSCTECLTWESWGPGSPSPVTKYTQSYHACLVSGSGTGMGWLLSTTACHLHMTSSGRLGYEIFWWMIVCMCWL